MLRDYVFTCSSGCELSGDGTSYFIVLAAAERDGTYYWGQNSAGTETNTPTNAGWSIADVAKYQDGSGGPWKNDVQNGQDVVKLMKVTWVAPDLWVENIRPSKALITLRNWTGGTWSWKVTDGDRSECFSRPGTTHEIDLPSSATAYTVTAHGGSRYADGNLFDTETFTTPALGTKFPELGVSNIGSTSATLSIANHTGDWWYLETADKSSDACKQVNANTSSVTLDSLAANTFYAYRAFSAAGCGNASVPLTWVTDTLEFNTTGSISATITDTTATSATLAVSGISEGQWSYRHLHYPHPYPYPDPRTREISQCVTSDSSTTSVVVTGLVSGTAYDFEVFRGPSCTINERVTVKAHTVQLTSGNVGPSSATLTLNHHEGAWYHQQAGGQAGAQAASQAGGCSTAVNGATANLTGLTPETEYTWKAYKAAGCADADAIASTSFTTATAGTHPPTGEEPDQAEADPQPDLYPEFGSATVVNLAYQQGSPIDSLTLPAADGGEGVLTYSLAPALPAGLHFDAATRTLSGTPTAALPATTYTYTATDADATDPDSVSLTFTIEVKAADTAPTFGDQQLPALRLPRGQVIEPQELPAATGGNGALTYALSPGLPAGLTFDPATRVLSGLPTAATGPRPYEYTATDADMGEPDVARLTFTIEVVLSAAEQAILEDGLAAQGRALLSGATGVIGERFRNPGASSVAEARAAACLGETGPGTEDAETEPECATGLLTTVAQAMLGMSGAGSSADPWGMADADETRLRGPGLTGAGAQPAWDWESLVWGRSFALPLNAQGAPGSAWTLWGAGDIQGFEGSPRQGRYDGQVRSLYLGVDMQWQAQWLAGAALAQSWGETDYVAEPGGRAGQLETTLTSVYPYVRGTLGSGLEVWAIGGYGRGEAEQTQAGAVDTRDLTMAMGATGVRQPMTEVGGAQVALVGGAGYLSLATEEGPGAIADLDVAVNRARLAVEAAWTAGGLAPYVQVGGRYDGGAGQTGAGLETVAGVRYTSERLEFEARGRWLATHAAEGYTEYGGLARLAVKPQADGTGFRMAVAPRWGAVGDAGVLGGGAALLDGGAMPGLGVNGMSPAMTRALMLESELGYGVAVFEGHGVLTPYGGFAFTGDETRQYRLGARLGMAQWLNLSLEGTRRDSTGPQPADQGVQLQLQGYF